MTVRIQYYFRPDQLSYLLNKLINIIKFENGHSFKLLEKMTLNKIGIIKLDECTLQIRAFKNNSYQICIEKISEPSTINFRTQSITLIQIMSGQLTIDQAIANQALFIRGNFEDVLNIYKLTISLLADASISNKLRDLWHEFLISWESNHEINLSPLESKEIAFDQLIRNIPENILTVSI